MSKYPNIPAILAELAHDVATAMSYALKDQGDDFGNPAKDSVAHEIPFYLNGDFPREHLPIVRSAILRMVDPSFVRAMIPTGPREWLGGVVASTEAAAGAMFVVSVAMPTTGIRIEAFARFPEKDKSGAHGMRCGICYHVVRANSSPA